MARRTPRQRRIGYVILMGTCFLLIATAWLLVRHFSVTAAIAMSAVAAFIPPIAAMYGNDPRE